MPHTVKLISLRKNCLLMAYKPPNFSFLGGKLRRGESLVRCLRRELKEETRGLSVRRLKFWREFNFVENGEDFTMSVFFGLVKGDVLPNPKDKLAATPWVLVRRLDALPMSEHNRDVLSALKADGYLKR